MMLIEHLALITAAAFAGAAILINVAEQPARLALTDGPCLVQWQRSYGRAAPMQAGLVLASAVLGLLAAWVTRDWRWALGALLILVNVPYTLLVIKPVNDRLHGFTEAQAGAETRGLISSWGRLHAGRSALGVAATLVYLWALR